MSLTKFDQQQQHSSSSIRRSSLLVNQSTTKKRSSVTTFLASSCSTLGSRKTRAMDSYYSPTSAPITNDEQMRHRQLDGSASSSFRYNGCGDNNESFKQPKEGRVYGDNGASGDEQGAKDGVSVLHDILVCPQSAPPSLNEPSYCVTASSSTTTTTTNNSNNNSDSSDLLIEKQSSTAADDDDELIESSIELLATKSFSPLNGQQTRQNTNQQQKSLFQVDEIIGGHGLPASFKEEKEGDEEEEEEEEPAQTKVKYYNTQSSNRRHSKEASPEPIVEVKHTSSSSSAASSSSDNSAEHSSDNNNGSSRKLIRRRTVRRYHRALVDEPASSGGFGTNTKLDAPSSAVELTISINKSDQQQPSDSRQDRGGEFFRNQFRTRQIGSYCNQQIKQQQQQQEQQQQTKTSSTSSSSSSLTSSTSKIAKCSITTNRKSTTSHRELISKSSSSSKASSNFDSCNKSTSGSQSATMQRERDSRLLGATKTTPETTTAAAAATTISTPLSAKSQTQRLLKLRLDDQFKVDLFDHRSSNNGGLLEKDGLARSSIEVSRQQEESSVHHSRQSFSSSSSTSTSMRAGSSLRKAAMSSSLASEAALVSSRQTMNGVLSSNLSTSSSSRHFKSSLLVSGDGGSNPDHTELVNGSSSSPRDSTVFLNSESLFASPDVRSLVKEIGTDFAELENALSSTASSSFRNRGSSSLSSRLFGANRRPISPLSTVSQYPAITASSSHEDPPTATSQKSATTSSASVAAAAAAAGQKIYPIERDQSGSHLSLTTEKDLELRHNFSRYRSDHGSASESSDRCSSSGRPNGERIRELMSQAQSHLDRYGSAATTTTTTATGVVSSNADTRSGPSSRLEPGQRRQEVEKERADKEDEGVKLHQSHCKAVMTESIERIDQRMSDLCKKFDECRNTEEAIDLLKIMIQMIEKAWSVPVCGDDLGFRLCNSLREAGGFDIILSLIQENDIDRKMIMDTQANSSSFAPPPPPPVLFDGELPTNVHVVNSKLVSLEMDMKDSDVEHGDVNGLGKGSKAHELSPRARNKSSPNPLRLNLSKLNQASAAAGSVQSLDPPATGASPSLSSAVDCADSLGSQVSENNTNNYTTNKLATRSTTTAGAAKDSDSDIITSDLGLDSASVDSLSYVTPPSIDLKSDVTVQAPRFNNQRLEPYHSEEDPSQQQQHPSACLQRKCCKKLEKEMDSDASVELIEVQTPVSTNMNEEEEEEEEEEKQEEKTNLMKDELVFLSARLLSQCLTSENRNYIVKNGLNQVIRLACNLITMKSTQCKRLLSSCSMVASKKNWKASNLIASSVEPEPAILQVQTAPPEAVIQLNEQDTQTTKSQFINTNKNQQKQQQQSNDHSDMHAIIGTEILQHLFKHSEDTCSKLISLGGLEAILYGCRSSNIETLRHCASALANLALYGGPEGQQMMIEQKAHVWLFPLAFNEDDNIQYYACLAIVVLVANQEIEADVLKSSTLDLVEPFVTSHEPQKFAESTTSHIHGQSPSWLTKLIPLLESKREEARNLACFHFAMEAYIKKEQSQTQVFKEIGAVEPLRKVGSSPIAIASKFACQALRLIGEKEPHKLSQQVPLWTSEDVSEWVSQIGFERFKAAFVDSRVDGDLLLQLDEDMLKTDIGIANGIIRRRFLRELSCLKRIADYSSVDKSGLSGLLGSTGCHDFVQYIYPMVQLGVTRDNIHLLDSEQLLRECKVANTIHRMKLAHAIKELQEKMAVAAASNECSSNDGTEQKTLDVFMSYRRSTGSQLASLLKVFLELRNFSVFIDVDRLEAGKFDNNLLDSIKAAKNFILILSPNALDRCIGDHECKDWVHKEIVAALASNCNIIPIIDNFHWPDPEQLPEDMRSITYFNGVRWYHEYQDACVDKVERFIRGEINNGTSFMGPQSIQSTQSSLQRLACGSTYSSTPSIVATPSIVPGFPSGPASAYSARVPFDTDYHPLSIANQYLHSQTTPSGGRRQP